MPMCCFESYKEKQSCINYNEISTSNEKTNQLHPQPTSSNAPEKTLLKRNLSVETLSSIMQDDQIAPNSSNNTNNIDQLDLSYNKEERSSSKCNSSPSFTESFETTGQKRRDDNPQISPLLSSLNLNACGNFQVVNNKALRVTRSLPHEFSEQNSNQAKTFTKRIISPPSRAQSTTKFRFDSDQDSFKNNYVFIQYIGSGSYANVIKAAEIKTGRVVALKICKLDHSKGIQGTLMKEISILKSLNHQNIIKASGVLFLRNKAVIVTEYIPMSVYHYVSMFQKKCQMEKINARYSSASSHNSNGQNGKISQYSEMYPNSPWNRQTVYTIFTQLIAAVSHLYENKIIHRDLKLTNIMIYPGENLTVKLIDFGLAICEVTPKMQSNVITLWYRPIELFLNVKTYGSYIDMWSCGIILFELLNSFVPVAEKNDCDQLNELIQRFQPSLEDIRCLQIEGRFSKLFKARLKSFSSCQNPTNSNNRSNTKSNRVKLLKQMFAKSKRLSSMGTFKPNDFDLSLLSGLLDTSIENRYTALETLRFLTPI